MQPRTNTFRPSARGLEAIVKSNFQVFDHLASSTRISAILRAADASYEETKKLPPRESLTFTNGFYAYCTAVFIDIRDSSKLPEKHKRPTLAKLYRSFISEMVAIMNGNQKCAEINIQGDAVWGVFDTPTKSDIDGVFSTAAQLSSEVDMLNCWYRSRGITEMAAGIGMSYGRSLMIKAGYSGSGINDVVYMGEVVNEASKLAGYGNKTSSDSRTMVSSVANQNLNDQNQALLSWNPTRSCYHGYVVNVAMNDWVKENCG